MKSKSFILVKMKYCYQSMRKWLVRMLWKQNMQLTIFMDLALRIDSYTSDESKGEMRLMTMLMNDPLVIMLR